MTSALAGLPDAPRAVLALVYWQGRTHQEVADMLGMPLGTVKSHARRGLERLRAQLGAEHATTTSPPLRRAG